jgi:hypothetical protein
VVEHGLVQVLTIRGDEVGVARPIASSIEELCELVGDPLIGPEPPASRRWWCGLALRPTSGGRIPLWRSDPHLSRPPFETPFSEELVVKATELSLSEFAVGRPGGATSQELAER